MKLFKNSVNHPKTGYVCSYCRGRERVFSLVEVMENFDGKYLTCRKCETTKDITTWDHHGYPEKYSQRFIESDKINSSFWFHGTKFRNWENYSFNDRAVHLGSPLASWMRLKSKLYYGEIELSQEIFIFKLRSTIKESFIDLYTDADLTHKIRENERIDEIVGYVNNTEDAGEVSIYIPSTKRNFIIVDMYSLYLGNDNIKLIEGLTINRKNLV